MGTGNHDLKQALEDDKIYEASTMLTDLEKKEQALIQKL